MHLFVNRQISVGHWPYLLRFGIMFFCLMFFSLLSLSSLPLWRDEVQLFVHERSGGAYGTFAYFSATVLCDLVPYRAMPPLIFEAVCYHSVGLAGHDHWKTFTLVIAAVGSVITSRTGTEHTRPMFPNKFQLLHQNRRSWSCSIWSCHH